MYCHLLGLQDEVGRAVRDGQINIDEFGLSQMTTLKTYGYHAWKIFWGRRNATWQSGVKVFMMYK